MYNVLKPGYEYIENRGFMTEFHIGDDINDNENLKYLISEMKRSLDPNINTNRIPITFYIDSNGGSAVHATLIANIIIDSPIHTIVYGIHVLSCATIIFAACDERYLYRNISVFMLHSLKLALYELQDETSTEFFEQYCRTNIHIIQNIINIFQKNTSLSISYLVNILYGYDNKDDYFTFEEIIDCNIAYII